MKNTIVIYHGEFQYNVVDDFMNELGLSLESKGYKVVDMYLGGEQGAKSSKDFKVEEVLCFIGFNGVASDIKIGQQSYYDIIKVPYVYWLVDHPVHLLDRILQPMQQKIIICVDETHCDFIERHLNNEAIVTYMPHAATERSSEAEKCYDVMFAGHLVEEKELQSMAEEIHRIISNLPHVINDQIWQKGNIVLHELMDELYEQIASAGRLFEGNIGKEGFLLIKVDRYVRATKRFSIIKNLLAQGIKVDYFGHLSEGHSFNNDKNFVQHGVVSFEKVKEAMSKSKVVLNVFPNFPNGGHERIFEATTQGALVLSDRNIFIEREFPDALIFDVKNIEAIVPDIKSVLENERVRLELVEANRKSLVENHTWHQRADELVFVVNAAIDYYSSLKEV